MKASSAYVAQLEQRVAELEAQLEAVGAGGVGSLRSPQADSVLEDAARYRWLRDQSFDEWKRIAWHVSGRSHAIWEDRDAAIDKTIAARKQGEKQ